MVTAVSLERLEAEFAASLICTPCSAGPASEAKPATHVAIMRRHCESGAPMNEADAGREWLLCSYHAQLVDTARIGELEGVRCCLACGLDVSGESYRHVVARVEPIGLPR